MQASQQQVRVPDFRGLSPDAARTLALSNHLRPNFSGSPSSDARVSGQSPAAGLAVPPGTVEQLQVAISQVRTPSLLKRSRAAAVARAEGTGLVLDISGDAGRNSLVVRQTPAPGAMVAQGSHVQVVMAAPVVAPPVNNPVPIPGASSGPATAIATPAAASAAGERTTAIVGRRKKEVSVPDLSKLTLSAAESVAKETGLVPEFSGDLSQDARVTAQSPAPGDHAVYGQVVQVVMSKSGGGVPPLAIVGGIAAVLVAAGVAWLMRKRPDSTPWPPDPPSANTAQPLPPVTFNAAIDVGRPTVRLSSEPVFAARALSVRPREEGSGR